MKPLFLLLALLLATVARADVAADVSAAVNKTITLDVPVELVSKPDAPFWKQTALKGQETHWKIKVPAAVFLGWLSRTDGISDSEKKAISAMAQKANTESFLAPLREVAKAAAAINADGKSLQAAVQAVDASMAKIKAGAPLGRSEQAAFGTLLAVCSKPTFKAK